MNEDYLVMRGLSKKTRTAIKVLVNHDVLNMIDTDELLQLNFYAVFLQGALDRELKFRGMR